MNWYEIEQVLDACKRDFDLGLNTGRRPMPTGLVFVPEGPAGQGIVTVCRHEPVSTLEDLESLIEAVKVRTPTAKAAGFVTLMPRHMWTSLQGLSVSPPNASVFLDMVGVVHVEHVTDGARTWVLNAPNLVIDGGWKLHSAGVRTAFPACIDVRRYGTTRGQA